MGIIETVIDLVDQVILTYVLGAFTNLAPTIENLWHVLFVIFIALFGYKIIFAGQFFLNDLIVNLIKIIAVLIFATESAPFMLFFYDSFTNLPNEIAGRVLAGGASSSSAPLAENIETAEQALSSFYDRGMTAGNNVVDNASFKNAGLYLYAIFIWVTAILFAGYALMLIVLSKLAVAILLAVAPIFIPLLIFPFSRGFFEGWFRTLVNYAIIPVFVYALTALVLTIIEGPLHLLETNSLSGQRIVTALGPFALVAIIGYVLMLQVTSMAAGVAGGFALATMGFAGNAVRGLRRMAGRAGGAGLENRKRSTAALQQALTNSRTGGVGKTTAASSVPSSKPASGVSTPSGTRR